MKRKETETLEDCRKRVHELEEENVVLRESSVTFGQLAERLRETLEVERRRLGERRAGPRAGPDRRKSVP